MAQITSGVGLISGINTSALISQLISLDAAPVSVLQTQVTSDQTLGAAYSSLGSQLQTLQTTAQSLEQPQAFQGTSATSSNPSVLTANTSTGAAVGTYTLRVARTVATQQLVSAGFTDATNAKVGAGTITIGEGSGGELATQTPLADLNGGAGVSRGQFRITDRSGASAVIDTSSAVSLDDVVADINTASTISVRASITDDHLVLTDTSGQASSNLIVQDLGTGSSAASLGIVANAASATVTGTDLNYVGRGTLLAALNDGRGVTLGTGGAAGDFTVHARDGSTFDVNLSGVTTVGGAVDAINAAGGGKVTASIPSGSTGIRLTDATGGTGGLTVTENNGSHAAADLGLTAAASGSTLTGSPVLAGLDSTLLSSLSGGSGLTLGRVTITDRTGTSHAVDLSGATDVQGVVAAIDAGTGGAVSAAVGPSGTGLQLTDATAGTGSLTVADADATDSATALGLAGTSAAGTLSGRGLDKQSVTTSTLLATLNGGQGIDKGTFTITNAAGTSATVDLTGPNVTTVGDVLYQINSKGLAGVSATINATGNGIELTDTSGGAGRLTVADTSGTAAADLNIKGAAAAGTTTIDGAYAKTITVGANDTLTTVAAAINAADAGVTASVISDGSTTNPYRLSLTATNAGTAGAVTFDAGTTGLAAQTLVAAQDAAVFVGGGGAGSSATTAQPLLVTSSSNTVTNVIPGVTLNLLGTSGAAVQLTVGADPTALVQSLTNFTATFNALTTSINTQSTYDTSTQSAGLLLGDPVALDVQNSVVGLLSAGVPTNPTYQTLASVGFTLGADDQLSFDADTFQAAFAADPAAVESLFNASTTTTAANGKATTTNTGVAYTFDSVLTRLADPVSGSVTQSEAELTTEEQGFTDQITQLNTLLSQKQAVYQTEFANMESALATLQSQSASLSGLTGTAAKTSTSTA